MATIPTLNPRLSPEGILCWSYQVRTPSWCQVWSWISLLFTHTYCLDQGKSWKVDVLLKRRVVSLKVGRVLPMYPKTSDVIIGSNSWNRPFMLNAQWLLRTFRWLCVVNDLFVYINGLRQLLYTTSHKILTNHPRSSGGHRAYPGS